MAGRARHLAFAHRHVGDGTLRLRDLDTVTGRTQLGLGRLDKLMRGGLRAVNAVARGAGKIPALVPTSLPARVVTAIVATQTRLVDLGRLDLTELADVALIFVVDVRLAWTVAALAAVGGRWSSWVHRHRVGSALERLALGVARLAGVAPNVTDLRIGRRRLLCSRCRRRRLLCSGCRRGLQGVG